MTLKQFTENALKIVHEYFRPEDFKCGGCLECEACHHYFVDIDELLSTHLTLLGESVKDLVPPVKADGLGMESGLDKLTILANSSGWNAARAQTINNIERFLS